MLYNVYLKGSSFLIFFKDVFSYCYKKERHTFKVFIYVDLKSNLKTSDSNVIRF